jgi:hypothetical protein
MRRTLIVLAVIVVVAAFFRGWVALSGPHRVPDGHKVDVNLSVDPDKLKEDAERVKEKAVELEEKARDEIRDATRPSDQKESVRP